MTTIKAITGAQAVAEAMRQINPDVVAAYPITPQTPVMEGFSQFVADGVVKTELIRVESEHSAMSATVGASAAGVRAMTATASAGLALMFEIVGVASGLRLPIVMPVANRALSAPINIHCDHGDSMPTRDHGWIQFYNEDAQEAYEHVILGLRLAEKVSLPCMVCFDGFITSHCVVDVELLDDNDVRKFVGERTPFKPLLNTDEPVTYGPLELTDSYFETKYQQEAAMEEVWKVFPEICKEFSKITGKTYNVIEKYQTKDADAIIVTTSSTAATTKSVVNKMRKDGLKVGLVKIIMFRPFPYKHIAEALKNAKNVVVLSRAASFGANAPLYGEVKNALYDLDKKPKLQSYIFGLGGREIYPTDIEDVFNRALKGKAGPQDYIGLRK